MVFEERVARLLKRSGCEYSVADVVLKIEKKEIHAFEYLETLILLEVQTFPQKQVLHVWGMEGTGVLRRLDAIVEWVKQIALALGCSEIRCQGRKGWEKALKKQGAAPLYTTLVMRLS